MLAVFTVVAMLGNQVGRQLGEQNNWRPVPILEIALPQRTEAAPASGVTRQLGNNSAPVQWKGQKTHICKYSKRQKLLKGKNCCGSHKAPSTLRLRRRGRGRRRLGSGLMTERGVLQADRALATALRQPTFPSSSSRET
jgi:hypothetical protein